jgi:hypothetical protein
MDVKAPVHPEQAPREPPPEFKQTFPSITWNDSNGPFIEPLHLVQAPPCAIHDDEDECNPFTFFSGTFEFARP